MYYSGVLPTDRLRLVLWRYGPLGDILGKTARCVQVPFLQNIKRHSATIHIYAIQMYAPAVIEYMRPCGACED